MNKIIETERIPIKLWLDDIDDKTLQQAKNLANLPFAFHHIAIMPDAHVGYGMPIGGVLATEGMVIPNAVGVDIGCGMCAVKTSLTQIDKENLKKILGQIRNAIPVGFAHQRQKQSLSELPKMDPDTIASKEYENAQYQVGTLGGGNHFIEIQKGSDGFIWIMVHSGSRNLGKKIADHYNRLAIEFDKKNFSDFDKKIQLAFLPVDSPVGQKYLKEMQYCVDFSLANKKLMINRVMDIFKQVLIPQFTNKIDFGEIINIAHNYASFENHFGKDVIVHRKGATKASINTIGIIPGSQGSNSFIVQGLGNPESFESCSHGAGRKLGREQAKRTLNLNEEIKKLENLGVLHTIRGVRDLEEATSAYKDINIVMENQKDLVKILVELTPLAVVIG
ncbi:MAG: RtcB family protein [Candidatus Shapirobacteria bacterium]|nr:RtcB family protein [Candidatus Shapirobacteria bacterium]